MGLKDPTTSSSLLLLLLSAFVLGALSRPGSQAEETTVPSRTHRSNLLPVLKELHLEIKGDGFWRRGGRRSSRRSMIGSTAPVCTYNECRGCRFKCQAEQVPVDAKDPVHSAYHYKCVCHKR